MHTLPVADIALQHILQSGLAIVRGEAVDAGRRTKVLHALVQIFTDANKGCQALSTQNFLTTAQEPPAFERFVQFFRYLNRSVGQDLPARLSEASTVLTAIEQQSQSSEDAKVRVAELMQGLLSAMARETALSPLVPPKEVELHF